MQFVNYDSQSEEEQEQPSSVKKVIDNPSTKAMQDNTTKDELHNDDKLIDNTIAWLQNNSSDSESENEDNNDGNNTKVTDATKVSVFDDVNILLNMNNDRPKFLKGATDEKFKISEQRNHQYDLVDKEYVESRNNVNKQINSKIPQSQQMKLNGINNSTSTSTSILSLKQTNNSNPIPNKRVTDDKESAKVR